MTEPHPFNGSELPLQKTHWNSETYGGLSYGGIVSINGLSAELFPLLFEKLSMHTASTEQLSGCVHWVPFKEKGGINILK